MVTINTTKLPGVNADILSATSASRASPAPGTPVFVGQADLANGSASAASAELLIRPGQASDLFGPRDTSLLTQAIEDAFVAGAAPVYAIAAAPTSEAEDLSGTSSSSGTLTNAPVIEDVDKISATINGTTKTVTLYYDSDPSSATPDTDEVLINPQTGKWAADESAGSTGDEISYEYADYAGVYTEVEDATINDINIRDVVDFIVPVDENSTAVSDAVTKSESMDDNDWFNIVLAGAGKPYIADTSNFSNSYDTSRLQYVYPSRKRDASKTLLGAYAGFRSNIGISTSPIFSRIQSESAAQFSLSRSQRLDLIASFVNPLEEKRGSIRIGEDLTTVTDSNDDEAAWRRGYARLVTDFITDQTIEVSEPFIGEFNNEEVLNALATEITSAIDPLLSANQIEAYSLTIDQTDSVTATVSIGVNTASPLRNIDLDVSAGEVRGGSRVEG